MHGCSREQRKVIFVVRVSSSEAVSTGDVLGGGHPEDTGQHLTEFFK